jgi:glycosyltransferase involved in cell wall biosynthesis
MRPIRVALETQFAYGTATGLGTYARRLAAALRERADVELAEFASAGLDVWRFDRRVIWDQLLAPWYARRCKPDVIHFTGGTLSFVAPHPCVLTVHDLAWLAGAVRGHLYSRAYFAGVQRLLARNADRIAVDTHSAGQEVVERLGVSPDKIAVAGAGVDDSWFALKRSPTDPPYVLAVGTVEARKDLETAVRAVSRTPGTVRLISVGVQTAYADRVRRVVAQLELQSRVELRGYVSDAELSALYAGAVALIFPSSYEGFGLPPLQALAARLPLVASDIPVLREVLGDCALFAQPGNVAQFANALSRVLADSASLHATVERGQMRARTFTWRSVAQRLVDVYRSLI